MPIYGGYNGPIRNPYFAARSGVIFNWAPSIPFGAPPTVIVSGHSQGGALAVLVGRAFQYQEVYPSVKVVTFGAPRPVGAELAESYGRSMQIARHMNVDDPVPLLPPRSATGALLATGDVRSARRLQNFTHPEYGYLLDATGAWTDGSIPPTDTLPAIGNFAGWLFNANGGAVRAHQMDEYVSRMQLYVNAHFAPAQDLLPVQRIPDTVRPTVQEDQQALRAQTQTIFRVAAQQQATNLIIPEAQQFSVRRKGRVWSVYFGGQLVAVGPTKRRAFNLKDQGNGLLARLQRAAFVDFNALETQFASYLNFAQLPGGGFQPLLQVALPQ